MAIGVFFGGIGDEACGLAFADEHLFEVAEFKFTRSLLIGEGGDARTVDFLIVEGGVLDVDEDAFGLRALDDARADIAREDRVFGEVFATAAIIAMAMEVSAG